MGLCGNSKKNVKIYGKFAMGECPAAQKGLQSCLDFGNCPTDVDLPTNIKKEDLVHIKPDKIEKEIIAKNSLLPLSMLNRDRIILATLVTVVISLFINFIKFIAVILS